MSEGERAVTDREGEGRGKEREEREKEREKEEREEDGKEGKHKESVFAIHKSHQTFDLCSHFFQSISLRLCEHAKFCGPKMWIITCRNSFCHVNHLSELEH